MQGPKGWNPSTERANLVQARHGLETHGRPCIPLREGRKMVDLWLACPRCGAKDPAMVEIRGAYDGGLYWLCQSDGFAWHRWPTGHYLNHRAQPYIDKVNAEGNDRRD